MPRTLLVAVLLISPALAADPAPLVRLGSDRFRQAERVTALTYSPYGKRLATLDAETIYLWDAGDGRLLRTIPGSDGRKFIALRFNADATALFAVALTEKRDAIVHHLDPAAGKTVAAATLMWAAKDHYNESEVRFSPDGAWVAARRGDRCEVALMNTATRKVVWSEGRADGEFYSLAFRADGRVLAVGGWDGQIRLVDSKTTRITHQFPLAASAIWHLAFSTDGKDLVASVHAGGDTDVIRFEAATGKVRWTFRTESADDLFFTRDGKAVVYFGPARQRNDPNLWQWLDAATGRPLDRVMDTGWQTMDLRADGKVMALGGFHGQVSQWDLTTRKRLDGGSADPGLPVAELSFTADATKVRGWANGWYEWDVKAGKQSRLSPPLDIGFREEAFGSKDSKWLVRGRVVFTLAEFGRRDRQPIGFPGDTFRFLADGRLIRNQKDRLAVYVPPGADPQVRVKAEARRRLEALLERATAPSPEAWRAVRACEALEGIATPDARALLGEWAKGAPGATLTREVTESLGRLRKR